MSKELKILRKYFESGTAEGDEAFLRDVFIPFDEYVDIVSVPKAGPRIVLGNKGAGKSAILRFFRKQLEDAEVPVLLLRPKDIEIDSVADHALGPLTRVSEKAILTAIAGKIGSEIKGLVINKASKDLLKESQRQGLQTQDCIEKLASILSPLGKAFSKIDFSEILKSQDGSNIGGLRNAIESSLTKNENLFYVLIDDTDQIASPNEPNHLNRIWAFLLAARSINERCNNIKFIITIRDEVWRRLKRDEAGQRDQVDHFRNLSKKIAMTEDNLKQVIKRRLEKVHEELSIPSYITVYNLFFDTNHVHIPTTDGEYRYWDDFIVKRSRERPRDSIQLIFKLCDKAISKNESKIMAGDVEQVMPAYSEERVDDLKRECDLECPQIKEVIRAFHNVTYDSGTFTLSPQATADFLNSLPSRFSIKLFSIALKNGNKDDVFLLWRYLHEIGFLNGRVSDTRKKYGFRHISIDEDPELVSPARWNDMQAILWEVHPAYRDYLIKLSKDKDFSFGTPKKAKKNVR
ncbi:hypothetical protein BJL95_10205 [Methylomonas sp. LWB]|uniref:P-loop ATPase, Sll1717 family n=1 Tax=Methylomonas sp. LWB TaxID=1905845 RepID=UPI0008DA6382|nr:hypothetical protein [Methylomonas sp. LWB]OHX36154.1 hypothetical protein BJL95_10205 [Methylomonas sp. LWB]